jgi:hypothetical protein
MKMRYLTAGLVGILMAGSAKAAVVYDTITDQTESARLLLFTMQNHAPMGDAFSTTLAETLTSVEVQLIDPTTGTNGGYETDTGSVLVYLVPAASTLPSATGLKLTGATYLGSISDTSLLGGSVVNNETLSINDTIAAGNYWIVLTSGSDPNNNQGTVNPTASTAGWAEIAYSVAETDGAIGVPTSDYSAYVNSTNTGFVDASTDNVFMMQIDATAAAPEPASVMVLGSALIGLGLRRRRSKKAVNSAPAA